MTVHPRNAQIADAVRCLARMLAQDPQRRQVAGLMDRMAPIIEQFGAARTMGALIDVAQGSGVEVPPDVLARLEWLREREAADDAPG